MVSRHIEKIQVHEPGIITIREKKTKKNQISHSTIIQGATSGEEFLTFTVTHGKGDATHLSKHLDDAF